MFPMSRVLCPYSNTYSRNSLSEYPQFQKGDGIDMEDNPVVGAQTPNKGGAKVADGMQANQNSASILGLLQ